MNFFSSCCTGSGSVTLFFSTVVSSTGSSTTDANCSSVFFELKGSPDVAPAASDVISETVCFTVSTASLKAKKRPADTPVNTFPIFSDICSSFVGAAFELFNGISSPVITLEIAFSH